MKRFIIDNENISIDNFLNTKKIKPKDKIYIVANTKQKLELNSLDKLCSNKIKIKTIITDTVGKDFADKVIVCLMGKLFNKKEKIYVVSNDKFYDSVIEFLNKKQKQAKFKRIGVKIQNNINTGNVNLIDDMSNIIKESSNLKELHLTLVAKFGSEKGLFIYNDLKQKAREIYAKNVELIPMQKSISTTHSINNSSNILKQLNESSVSENILNQTRKLISDASDLQNLHFKLKEKFGDQDGLKAYKEIRDEAKKIYSKKIEEKPENMSYEMLKKRQEVEELAKKSKNLSEFHNALVKKYGEEGVEIYKKLKDKIKSYYEKRQNDDISSRFKFGL